MDLTNNPIANAYKSMETMFQSVYDAVPDKAQIATHPAGAIMGCITGYKAGEAVIKQGVEFAKGIPEQFAKNYEMGNYSSCAIESMGRTFGVVVAGGVAVVVAAASAANVHAAINSLRDVPAMRV